MKIADLEDKQFKVNMDVKVIYDQMQEKEMFNRRTKTVVVVDIDAEKDGVTAMMDLFDDDIDKYKFQSKIRLVNCMAKKIHTKRGDQMLLTYGYAKGELIGHYEEIE